MQRVFLFVLLIIIYAWQRTYAQELSSSIYEGTGICSDTDLKKARDCALEEAKRDALDKAGAFLQATQKVDMFQLTQSEIESFAGGFVRILDKEISTELVPGADVIKAVAKIKAEIDNSKILDGISSLIKTNDKLKESDKPLKFDFSITGRKKLASGENVRVLVNESTGLKSGEFFQISFTTSQDCYVYVINVDSRGSIFSAFPNKETGILDNYLAAGKSYTLPSPDMYYQLDDHPGKETLYFMGSLEPMEDIRFILDNLKELDNEQVAMRGLLSERSQARGIAKIVQTDEGGVSNSREIQSLKLEGSGSLVLKLSFTHY